MTITYKMRGEDAVANGTYDTWLAIGTPDTTGALYGGALATPLRDIIVVDSWGVEAHKTSHQVGGSDELSVAGLSGLLVTAQTPIAHKTSHQVGGSDAISVAGLSGLLATAQTPIAHKTSHQLAGTDELSVAGLSGLLATAQTPIAHKTSHQLAGADAINVVGLSGLLADPQKIEVYSAGVLVGTRKRVNVIAGAGALLTLADNPGADRVDLTVDTDSRAMFWRKPATPHAQDAEFEDGTYGPYTLADSTGWGALVSAGAVDYASTPANATSRATANYRGTFAAVQPNNLGPALIRRIAARPVSFQLRTRISLPAYANVGGSGGTTAGQSRLIITPEVSSKPDLNVAYNGIGWIQNGANTINMQAQSRQASSNVLLNNMTALTGYGVDGEFILWVSGTTVEYWFRNEAGAWRIGTHSTLVAAGSPLWVVWLAAPGTSRAFCLCDYIRQQDDLSMPF